MNQAEPAKPWQELPAHYWGLLLKEWTRFLLAHTQNEMAIANAKWILIGGLALAVLLVVLIPCLLLRSLRGPADKKPTTPKEFLKAAKKEAKANNFVRAGELYEKAERVDKAVEAYIKGRSFVRASELMTKRLNKPDKALELLLSNNLWEPAGRMQSAMGKDREAAANFLKAGKEILAADHFEKAGDLRRAAELFSKQQDFARAAASYARAQMWKPAAENYEAWFRNFRHALEESGTGTEKDRRTLHEIIKKAAYHYKQAGDFLKAADLCIEGGMKPLAADLYAQAGASAKAAELFLEAKELRRAAELFYKAGNKQKAAELLAQYHQKEGNNQEAAKYLELAGEFLAAADLWAGAGSYEKAAGLYMKGGDSKTAADMYLAVGKTAEALKVYESMGDMDAVIRHLEETGNRELLAELAQRRGRHFEAAMSLLEDGNHAKAAALLEKVPPDNPRYGEAMAKLGAILIEQGRFPEAQEKLQAMASRIPFSPTSLDHYYNLALCYEQTGILSNAVTLYQQIAAFNPHHKDVVARFQLTAQRLGQQQGGQMARPGSGGGTIQNRYKTIKELGRGGMGIVYLAQDLKLPRKVAFKVLPPELKHNKQIIEFFLQEAHSLAAMDHPYILKILDAGEEQGVYYILMEFVEGNDLKQLMAGKRLPVAGALKIFKQLCEAMQYAHNMKIIHRDIKPANIMWTTNNYIKVMDFGLAKIMDKFKEGKSIVGGTPYYMSPEQNLGRNVDHRTDIYAMGITMYELLTGRVPFSDGDIGYHHMNTPPPPPRQFNPQIPPELEAVILKCIAKNPAQRWQTAGDALTELERSVQA